MNTTYPFSVIAEPEGGYVITFPDLPGCLTQVETADDIGPMAEDARRGWIEIAYEAGIEIPTPSYPEEHSGKFNLRIPRSLHRELAEEATRDGVSLNQYVGTLLARRDAQTQVTRQLASLGAQFVALQSRFSVSVTGVPKSPRPNMPLRRLRGAEEPRPLAV